MMHIVGLSKLRTEDRFNFHPEPIRHRAVRTVGNGGEYWPLQAYWGIYINTLHQR